MDDEKAERFYKRALYVARVRYHMGDEAEDIAQNVLLKFLERPYIKQTVQQAVVDEIKKLRLKEKTIVQDALEILKEELEAKAFIRWDNFDIKLAKLEPYQRAFLMLRFHWGLSYQEIAECYAVPIEIIKQYFEAIFRKLAVEFKD